MVPHGDYLLWLFELPWFFLQFQVKNDSLAAFEYY